MARGWHGDPAGHAAAARKAHHTRHMNADTVHLTRGERAARTRAVHKHQHAAHEAHALLSARREYPKASAAKRAANTRKRRQRNPAYAAMFEAMTRPGKGYTGRRKRSKK